MIDIVENLNNPGNSYTQALLSSIGLGAFGLGPFTEQQEGLGLIERERNRIGLENVKPGGVEDVNRALIESFSRMLEEFARSREVGSDVKRIRSDGKREDYMSVNEVDKTTFFDGVGQLTKKLNLDALVPTYGYYGGPGWTGGERRGMKFDVAPVDALDALFRIHDYDVALGEKSADPVGTFLAANSKLRKSLQELDSDKLPFRARFYKPLALQAFTALDAVIKTTGARENSELLRLLNEESPISLMDPVPATNVDPINFDTGYVFDDKDRMIGKRVYSAPLVGNRPTVEIHGVVEDDSTSPTLTASHEDILVDGDVESQPGPGFLVYAPPASGKSTFTTDHKGSYTFFDTDEWSRDKISRVESGDTVDAVNELKKRMSDGEVVLTNLHSLVWELPERAVVVEIPREEFIRRLKTRKDLDFNTALGWYDDIDFRGFSEIGIPHVTDFDVIPLLDGFAPRDQLLKEGIEPNPGPTLITKRRCIKGCIFYAPHGSGMDEWLMQQPFDYYNTDNLEPFMKRDLINLASTGERSGVTLETEVFLSLKMSQGYFIATDLIGLNVLFPDVFVSIRLPVDVFTQRSAADAVYRADFDTTEWDRVRGIQIPDFPGPRSLSLFFGNNGMSRGGIETLTDIMMENGEVESSWVRDLTLDGDVEANPGPEYPSIRAMSVRDYLDGQERIVTCTRFLESLGIKAKHFTSGEFAAAMVAMRHILSTGVIGSSELSKLQLSEYPREMIIFSPVQVAGWLRDLTTEGLEPNPGPASGWLRDLTNEGIEPNPGPEWRHSIAKSESLSYGEDPSIWASFCASGLVQGDAGVDEMYNEVPVLSTSTPLWVPGDLDDYDGSFWTHAANMLAVTSQKGDAVVFNQAYAAEMSSLNIDASVRSLYDVTKGGTRTGVDLPSLMRALRSGGAGAFNTLSADYTAAVVRGVFSFMMSDMSNCPTRFDSYQVCSDFIGSINGSSHVVDTGHSNWDPDYPWFHFMPGAPVPSDANVHDLAILTQADFAKVADNPDLLGGDFGAAWRRGEVVSLHVGDTSALADTLAACKCVLEFPQGTPIFRGDLSIKAGVFNTIDKVEATVHHSPWLASTRIPGSRYLILTVPKNYAAGAPSVVSTGPYSPGGHMPASTYLNVCSVDTPVPGESFYNLSAWLWSHRSTLANSDSLSFLRTLPNVTEAQLNLAKMAVAMCGFRTWANDRASRENEYFRQGAWTSVPGVGELMQPRTALDWRSYSGKNWDMSTPGDLYHWQTTFTPGSTTYVNSCPTFLVLGENLNLGLWLHTCGATAIVTNAASLASPDIGHWWDDCVVLAYHLLAAQRDVAIEGSVTPLALSIWAERERNYVQRWREKIVDRCLETSGMKLDYALSNNINMFGASSSMGWWNPASVSDETQQLAYRITAFQYAATRNTPLFGEVQMRPERPNLDAITWYGDRYCLEATAAKILSFNRDQSRIINLYGNTGYWYRWVRGSAAGQFADKACAACPIPMISAAAGGVTIRHHEWTPAELSRKPLLSPLVPALRMVAYGGVTGFDLDYYYFSSGTSSWPTSFFYLPHIVVTEDLLKVSRPTISGIDHYSSFFQKSRNQLSEVGMNTGEDEIVKKADE